MTDTPLADLLFRMSKGESITPEEARTYALHVLRNDQALRDAALIAAARRLGVDVDSIVRPNTEAPSTGGPVRPASD